MLDYLASHFSKLENAFNSRVHRVEMIFKPHQLFSYEAHKIVLPTNALLLKDSHVGSTLQGVEKLKTGNLYEKSLQKLKKKEGGVAINFP